MNPDMDSQAPRQQGYLVHVKKSDLLGLEFKSEAQMRFERTPVYKNLLEKIAELPVDLKNQLSTAEGFGEWQKHFQRLCDAAVDQRTAGEKLMSKTLGFGELLAKDFLSAMQRLPGALRESSMDQQIRDFDSGLFAFLGYAETRDAFVRGLSVRLAIACSKNDQSFLKRLGRALSKRAVPVQSVKFDELDWFLYSNWVKLSGFPSPIGLYLFSDLALIQFLDAIGKDVDYLSSTKLAKRRERLGLMQIRTPMIIKAWRKNGEVWVRTRRPKAVQTSVGSTKSPSC
jgi:hypothetical protein